MALRTSFYGRGGARLSQRILARLRAEPGLEIVSVTAEPGPLATWNRTPLAVWARRRGMRLASHEEVESTDPSPELIVSCCNSVIFTAAFIARCRFGIVNLHPALLPDYRGCHGLEHALLNGEPECGCTIHYCTSKIDRGPIIMREVVPIRDHDSARTLWPKLDQAAERLITRTLPVLLSAAARGSLADATPQEHEKGNYYGHNSLPEELELSPAWSWETIRRYVRAYEHPRRTRAFFRSGDVRLEMGYSRGRMHLANLVSNPLSEAVR